MDQAFAIISAPLDGQGLRFYPPQTLIEQPTHLLSEQLTTGFVCSPWNSASTWYLKDVEKVSDISAISLKYYFDEGIISEQNTERESAFIQRVEDAKKNFEKGDLSKVVLSRTKWLPLQEGYNYLELFERLRNAYPNSLIYLFSSEKWGTWIGATPEVLLNYHEGTAQIMSLAGTLFDHKEVWSGKEEQEQAVTSRFIEEVLQWDEEESPKIKELRQGSLRHLLSVYEKGIEPERVGSYISALSPTPAVSGYPVNKAIDYLENNEPHQRSLYTGFIGFGENSNWNIHVNLRCAQLFRTGINLFAGCGINSGSEAQREWYETEKKMNVIVECLS